MVGVVTSPEQALELVKTSPSCVLDGWFQAHAVDGGRGLGEVGVAYFSRATPPY